MILDKKVRTITSGITLALTDISTTIRCNSSSPMTITLPTASGFPNFNCDILNKNSGEVTCDGLVIGQDSHAHVVCDGTSWSVAIGGGSGSISLEDLEDVVIAPGLSGGQVLIYGEGTWANADLPEPEIYANLYQLEDVNLTGATDGAVLTYNGSTSKWENGASFKVLDVSWIDLYIGSIYEGFGTISSSGVYVTGVGTSFLSSVSVGDGITDDNWNLLGYVQSISSNTELQFEDAPSVPLSGQIYLISKVGNDLNPIIDPEDESYPVLGWATFEKVRQFLDSYQVIKPQSQIYITVMPRAWVSLELYLSNSYPCEIFIYGNEAKTTGTLQIYSGNRYYIEGLRANSFEFDNNSFVRLEETIANYGYVFRSTQSAFLSGCVGNGDNGDSILKVDSGHTYVNGLSGNSVQYGMYATQGGSIYKVSGPYPTGTIANEFSDSAGLIR